jgi:hypothetical protein
VLVADKVFLNVGTHAAIPSVPGLKAAQPLTNLKMYSFRTSLWAGLGCR